MSSSKAMYSTLPFTHIYSLIFWTKILFWLYRVISVVSVLSQNIRITWYFKPWLEYTGLTIHGGELCPLDNHNFLLKKIYDLSSLVVNYSRQVTNWHMKISTADETIVIRMLSLQELHDNEADVSIPIWK